jgi:hypothetical protein
LGTVVIIIGVALHFGVVCRVPLSPLPGLGGEYDDDDAMAMAFRHHGG